MIERGTIAALGTRMHPWSMAETVDEIAGRIGRGEFTQHVVVNVAKIVNMRVDDELRDSVESCDIVNIDGMGVVWGARFLGNDVPERVAGIDLFHRLLAMSAELDFPVFLLGAREEIVDETVRRVESMYPGLVVAGHHHGYFWDDEASVVEAIKASGARMLFVAITSPAKESFINRWRDELGVDFVMGVGGAFDIAAGHTTRAPGWMRPLGLEWTWRLAQEPRRMWRRCLVTNSKFVGLLLAQKVRQLLGRNEA